MDSASISVVLEVSVLRWTMFYWHWGSGLATGTSSKVASVQVQSTLNGPLLLVPLLPFVPLITAGGSALAAGAYTDVTTFAPQIPTINAPVSLKPQSINAEATSAAEKPLLSLNHDIFYTNYY